MSKRELQVGDRVRVYGAAFSVRDQKWTRFEAVSGRITKTDSPCNEVRVDMDIYGDVLCNPRQCVRLLPRKKPCPPQGEERIERCVAKYVTGDIDAFCFIDEHHAESFYLAKRGGNLENEVSRYIRLVELKPGEYVINRKMLEKAVSKVLGEGEGVTVYELAKQLGFEWGDA